MDRNDTAPQGTGRGITAEWVWDYFDDVDTRDPDRIAAHFADSARFRFANADPAEGREAVRAGLADFFGAVTDMHHTATGLWLGDRSAVFEADVTYVRAGDGETVVLPCASVIRLDGDAGVGGRIADYRILMDVTPVLAPAD